MTTTCPDCRTELTCGEIQHCTSCRGTWIGQDVLASRVRTMQSLETPTMQWARTHARLGRRCPACMHAMETLTLFDVNVERCHSHGVWFAEGDLSEMLRRSSRLKRADDDGDVALWMCADAGADLLDASVCVGAEIAAEAVSAGLLEGVLDVIGGIFSHVLDAF